MRILSLNIDIPFPPLGGGQRRSFHLIQALARQHEVTLIGFHYGEPRAPAPFPVRVIAVPWHPPPRYANAWPAADTDEPWFVSYFESAAMSDAIGAVATSQFDLVLLGGTAMGRYLPLLPDTVLKVLNLYDLHSQMALRDIEGRTNADSSATREAMRIVRFEQNVARQCTALLVCSDREAEGARAILAHPRVHVVPNGVDTNHFVPRNVPAQAGCVLFVGKMDYAPNSEAVRWFADDIWPIICQDRPDARFHVVGMGAPPAVEQLACASVAIHGQVPDALPFLEEAEVVVVPLRHGGGTRLKILEASAAGKAIVSTSLGAEGLDFVHGRDIVLADTADDFAAAVIALLGDAHRRAALGAAARQTALRYDWGPIGDACCRLLESL